MIIAVLPSNGRDARLLLAGEADVLDREALASALSGAARTGGDIHVGVRDLSFADVAIARLLADTAASLRPGRRLVLHAPQPAVRRLLRLCWPDAPGLDIRGD